LALRAYDSISVLESMGVAIDAGYLPAVISLRILAPDRLWIHESLYMAVLYKALRFPKLTYVDLICAGMDLKGILDLFEGRLLRVTVWNADERSKAAIRDSFDRGTLHRRLVRDAFGEAI
jgi:hypothetical protein